MQPIRFFKKTWQLLKETYKEFSEDNAIKLSASLSYYTIFSLPPLIIIILSICGVFFGREAVTGRFFGQINGLVGNAADGSSAGGHWNPTFKSHGKWGSASYHKGDIGNFTADAKGNGTITLTTSEWCIGCGDNTKDILGKGLIVHEGADDFTTQPTGNAGGRVACSAIIK
jgi:hypothetical protein